MSIENETLCKNWNEKLISFLFVSGTSNEAEPEFSEAIPNITIPVGRDIQLPCIVDNLGSYRVSSVLITLKNMGIFFYTNNSKMLHLMILFKIFFSLNPTFKTVPLYRISNITLCLVKFNLKLI